MIQEFAIDPDYFESIESLYKAAEGCSIHFGRVISEFPTQQWLTKVRSKLHSPTSFRQTQSLEVILQNLATRGGLIDFKRPYASNLQWLENAAREHVREPFSAVISRTKNTSNTIPIHGDELSMHAPPWEVSNDNRIPRTAADLVKAIRPLMAISNHLIFVDPHLTPDTSRYRNALKAYLAEAKSLHNQWRRIEFHTWHPVKPDKDPSERSVGLQRRITECKTYLPGCLPKSMPITIFVWDKHSGGDEMHARYVLTDKGAIQIDSGLDLGPPGTVTPVRIVGKTTYDGLLKDFSAAGSRFLKAATFTVT
jgi:hypothetical protein